MMAPQDGRYHSADDLVNERGYDATRGEMTDRAMTIDRRENGLMNPPNEYESYEDIKRQVSVCSFSALLVFYWSNRLNL